jgi:hypothetical protein
VNQNAGPVTRTTSGSDTHLHTEKQLEKISPIPPTPGHLPGDATIPVRVIRRRTMTDEELERTVIETLVSHPPTEDCWKDPIHAVDRIAGKERGWSSDDARV